MLGLIVGLAVAAVTIIVADLLRNDEIFDKDWQWANITL